MSATYWSFFTHDPCKIYVSCNVLVFFHTSGRYGIYVLIAMIVLVVTRFWLVPPGLIIPPVNVIIQQVEKSETEVVRDQMQREGIELIAGTARFLAPDAPGEPHRVVVLRNTEQAEAKTRCGVWRITSTDRTAIFYSVIMSLRLPLKRRRRRRRRHVVMSMVGRFVLFFRFDLMRTRHPHEREQRLLW